MVVMDFIKLIKKGVQPVNNQLSKIKSMLIYFKMFFYPQHTSINPFFSV